MLASCAIEKPVIRLVFRSWQDSSLTVAYDLKLYLGPSDLWMLTQLDNTVRLHTPLNY